MSQFRFRKPSHFTPLARRANSAPSLSVRVCSRVRVANLPLDERAPDLLRGALALALRVSAAVGLATLAQTVRAQAPVVSYDHDIALHFKTADVSASGSNNAGKMASMWGPNLPGGFSATYNLTTGWNANTTFGSFTDFRIPSIDLGPLGTIPALDLGEWGAGGQLFSKAQNTGLVFRALATGGGVSVDYPVHVKITTPKFIRAGYPVTVHVTYAGDVAAKVSTYSPQASATMSLNADIQIWAKGRLELAGFDLFNTQIIDACSRTDPDSPLRGQVGPDKSLTISRKLLDSSDILNSLIGTYTTINLGENPTAPDGTIGFKIPIINTVGQPGSVSNYQAGSASVGQGASYEYTAGITIPDAIKNNPNATYARGQDSFVTLTADFTNILTNSLEQAGIPVPQLEFEKDLGKGVTLKAGLLDFTGSISLGFLQEFGFVPKPQISLTIDGVGTTAPVDIDPVAGANITFTMPGQRDAPNPDVPLSVRITPHVTLGNDFTSNTYFNLHGGLGLDPIILSTDTIDLGKGVRIPSFSFDPFPLSVGASLPIQLYTTNFEIPFAAQDGDSFYIQTKTPPRASLFALSPSLAYVDERNDSMTGLTANGTYIVADTANAPGENFAAAWFGTQGSGTGALQYTTTAYWDQTASSNELFEDDARNPNSLNPIFKVFYAFFYSSSNSRPDLTPGIHHVYAKNSASVNNAAFFDPLTTSLPLNIVYPAPHIDVIGRPQSDAFYGPTQDPTDKFRYVPFDPVIHGSTIYGTLAAGTGGQTIVAVDNTPFNPTDITIDQNADGIIPRPFAEGSYSRLKMDGKLLAPDPNFNNIGRSWVTGIVPASMLATPGLKTIQITNPTTGGRGGDSNVMTLFVSTPTPKITDATLVQGTVDKTTNKVTVDSSAHQITAGSPDTKVLVTGSGFTPDTLAYFNDTAKAKPLTTKLVDSGHMYVTLPAASLTQPLQTPQLTLYTSPSKAPAYPARTPNGGTAMSGAIHVVANTPKITNVTAGGASINAVPLDAPKDMALTISGVHFWPGLSVTFGNNTLATKFVDEQTLTAILPASALSDKAITPDQIALLAQGTDYDGNAQRSNPFGIQVLYARPVLQGTNALNAVLPPAVQVGISAPVLTVTGGLFYPNSKVTINTLGCDVKFVDSMHLSVTVPSSIANATGNYLVTVTNPTSNGTDGMPLNDGGPSNAMPFQVLKYAPQAQLSMTATVQPISGNVVGAQITLTNTGAADATGLVSQYAVLAGAASNSFSLPKTLAVGQSVTLSATFLVPASTHGTIQTLKLLGTMNGATFSSTARVRVP